MGESSPLLPLEKARSSASTALQAAGSSPPLLSLGASARVRWMMVSASSALPGAGSRPDCARNASSAWNAACSSGGRSNLEKSDIKNSPGVARASESDANVTVLGCLTCTTIPPLM